MGIDLHLINRLWFAGLAAMPEAKGRLDYLTALAVGIALLSNKELAQSFVEETWDTADCGEGVESEGEENK